MSVKIHGKEYRTVAERVNLFHDENKDAVKSIKTKILFTQEDKVVMRATVTVGDSIYTGHAEEVYGSSRINETSALENCETSAIGRALASAGLGGSEFASADEVANAIINQGEDKKDGGLVWAMETRESACTLKKHKGENWADVPSNYLDWMANKSSLGAELKMFATAELLHRAGGEKKTSTASEKASTASETENGKTGIAPDLTSITGDELEKAIDGHIEKTLDDELEKALQEDGEPTTADEFNEPTKDDLAKDISAIADRIGLETFKMFKNKRIGNRKFSECSIDELIKLIGELNSEYPDDGLPV